MRVLLATALLLAAACGSGTGRPSGPPTPVRDTLRTVTGRVSYFTTGPRLTNRDGAGRLIPQPGLVDPTLPRRAPGFPVEILSPTGELLAQGLTDTNGIYTITVNFGQESATPLIVRVRAQLNLPFGAVVRVLANRSATGPYAHQTPLTGDPSSEVMTIDLLIDRAEGSAAYHILETLHDGFLMAKAGILARFPDVDILWEPGNGDASSLAAGPTVAELTVAGGIAGDPTSNTDAWDSPKLMRLLGELLLTYFSNDVAPQGTPNGSLLVPSAAWREGFLDFWACIGRGSPEYWETEGSGSEGRVTRFFNIESFFDASLGTLGPDDPNVYQEASAVGIGSSFTVAEVLWDIHDPEDALTPGDSDLLEFPLFLTLRFLETIKPGSSYPYLYTLLDVYASDQAISDTQLLRLLTLFPEDQGIAYPATLLDETIWPPPISASGLPGEPIGVPFDGTVAGEIDAAAPSDIGFHAQRYFVFDLALSADVTATLTTAGTLRVDIMDLSNTVLATGTTVAIAQDLQPKTYIVRVSSASGPQQATFDLRLQTDPP
ncbi:MAG: hypothetical protein ACYTEZ_14710 [Planctomycetota bacterium]